jgi:CubicO group peptidase (beta-lactamase class C family)
MKSLFVVTCLLLAANLCAQNNQSQLKRRSLDSVAQAAAGVYMRDSSKVALSIGIVHGRDRFTYHFGETIIGSGLKPNDHTLYEIGSITKTFTGLMVAYAIENEKMNLNADIRKYMPGSFPNLQYRGELPVKLGYLISHTAQFPNSFSDEWYKTRSQQKFLEELSAIKLDSLQPLKYGYSNAGYQTLGYMLQHVYGMRYEDILKKYITGPLGMKQTTTSLAEAKKMQLATGYNANRQTALYEADSFPAGGSIKSSVADMLNYLRYQLDEKDKAVKLTHRIFRGDVDKGANGFQWSIGKTYNWDYYLYTDGGTKGFRTFCMMYPEYDLGFILLTNETDANAGRQLYAIVQALLNNFRN